jgi:hypothetical protein
MKGWPKIPYRGGPARRYCCRAHWLADRHRNEERREVAA